MDSTLSQRSCGLHEGCELWTEGPSLDGIFPIPILNFVGNILTNPGSTVQSHPKPFFEKTSQTLNP